MDILQLYQKAKAKEKGIDFEVRTDYFRNALVITATKGDFHAQAAISIDEAVVLNFPIKNRIEFAINQLIREVDK